tara:strand:+ start:323 stop:1429 length:1107 start_codon:yes stop_codon:yes gene_type:complete
MNWNYFIESNETLLFSNAQVGSCSTLLTFDIAESALEGVWAIEIVSQSTLLNGKQQVSFEISADKKLAIPLNEFNDQVHVLKITMESKGQSHECFLALIPVCESPKVCIVVGSPRSGTTVVGNMVQRALLTKAHGEAHLAELFNNLVAAAESHLTESLAANNKGTMVWEMPSTLLKAQLVKQLRDLYIMYYGNEAIVDKTPGLPMLRALPLLMLAFPNAKVVYCQRRGLENVASRMRKFPKAKFEGHCQQWAQTVQLWQRTKNEVSKLLNNRRWFFEVEQFELATSPDNVISSLGEFLGAAEPSVNRMFKYQEKNSPQVTSGKPSDVTSFQTINWSSEQKTLFLEKCASVMDSQGYSLDESYYKKEAQ